VRRKLRKLLADRDEGIACDSENLTLGSYLDRWLDAVKGSVRDRTWERHEQVVRVHLKPTIGSVKLDRVNALQVQSMYRRKLEAGLSPRSVAIVHATLRKALKQAVKVVSEMLGHAGVSITLDTYSHVLPNMQEAAAKAMEDALQ
jgi:integrase